MAWIDRIMQFVIVERTAHVSRSIVRAMPTFRGTTDDVAHTLKAALNGSLAQAAADFDT